MAATDGSGGVRSKLAGAIRRVDFILLLIVAAALLLRLQLASTVAYIHDEENTAIPLSQTISLAPGNVHLPLRGENHPALPAYFVRASGELFGTTPLGYRSLPVFSSIVTILLIFRMASRWYGPGAGRWAAALLAFNEFYLAISARATAHVPHLLLITSALYAFSRFLATQRAAYLYAAGAFAGGAFYCKEHSALLLPVFLLALMQPAYRHWLRRPHVYIAAAVYALVIAPDVTWNLTRGAEMVHITYGRNENVAQATYRSHLQRIGGLGFSPYPAMFYARDAVKSLHARITRRELRDETPEYHSMNSALGVLLLVAVILTTARISSRAEPLTIFLLLAFWMVLGFFTLIRPGSPPGRLDSVSWIWVEGTMLAAVTLAGARLSEARGILRVVVWTAAASALGYAVRIVSP